MGARRHRELPERRRLLGNAASGPKAGSSISVRCDTTSGTNTKLSLGRSGLPTTGRATGSNYEGLAGEDRPRMPIRRKEFGVWQVALGKVA